MSVQFWLFLGLALFVVEMVTPTLFLFACFGVAALVISLLVYLFHFGMTFQWVVFLAISTALVAVSRPLAKKITQKKSGKNISIDSLVGKSVTVSDVDKERKNAFGKSEGEKWLLKTETEESLELGETVEVVKVEGTKLIVRKKNK